MTLLSREVFPTQFFEEEVSILGGITAGFQGGASDVCVVVIHVHYDAVCGGHLGCLVEGGCGLCAVACAQWLVRVCAHEVFGCSGVLVFGCARTTARNSISNDFIALGS